MWSDCQVEFVYCAGSVVWRRNQLFHSVSHDLVVSNTVSDTRTWPEYWESMTRIAI